MYTLGCVIAGINHLVSPFDNSRTGACYGFTEVIEEFNLEVEYNLDENNNIELVYKNEYRYKFVELLAEYYVKSPVSGNKLISNSHRRV